MCEFCILHCIRPCVKLNGWNESFFSFSALVRITPVADPPRSPHLHADPGLWNRASDWTPLFYFCPPFARFPLIECVLSIRGGFRRGGWVLVGWLVGWGRGRRRREGWGGGDGGGFCGTSRRDERGLSLFYSPRLSSFQLFEASHQTGLNSRRDTICLSTTTTTTSLLGISPTHPSILPSLPIYLDSVLCIYLWPPASVQPFTRSQCLSVTADRRPEGKEKKKKKQAQVLAECKHWSRGSIFLVFSVYSMRAKMARTLDGHSIIYSHVHPDGFLLQTVGQM